MKKLLTIIKDTGMVSRLQFTNMQMRNRGFSFKISPSELTTNPSTLNVDRVQFELSNELDRVNDINVVDESHSENVVKFMSLCTVLLDEVLPFTANIEDGEFKCIGYDANDNLIAIESLPMRKALEHKDVLLTRVTHKDEFHVAYDNMVGIDTLSISNMHDVDCELTQYIAQYGMEPTLGSFVTLLRSGMFEQHIKNIKEKVVAELSTTEQPVILNKENLDLLLSEHHIGLCKLVLSLT